MRLGFLLTRCGSHGGLGYARIHHGIPCCLSWRRCCQVHLIDTCLVSPNKIPDDVKEAQTDKHQIISIALHGLFLFLSFLIVRVTVFSLYSYITKGGGWKCCGWNGEGGSVSMLVLHTCLWLVILSCSRKTTQVNERETCIWVIPYQ